jgi:uncharacterized protein YndB with AHSA1/START domain
MIRKQIVLPSPRADVWEALTDPERLEDWFANEVELDLREGGDATFRWGNGEERHAKITVVDPERRLSFDWDDEDGQFEGTVAFTLDAADRRRDGAGGRPRSTCRHLRWRVSDPLGQVFSALADPEPPARARLPLRPGISCGDGADGQIADDAAGRFQT